MIPLGIESIVFNGIDSANNDPHVRRNMESANEGVLQRHDMVDHVPLAISPGFGFRFPIERSDFIAIRPARRCEFHLQFPLPGMSRRRIGGRYEFGHWSICEAGRANWLDRDVGHLRTPQTISAAFP